MITKVRRVPQASGEWGEEGHLQINELFKVHCNNVGGRVTMPQVLSHDLIPKRYSRHPEVEEALCLRVSPARVGPGNRLWEVTAHYSTDWRNDIENPLERPADITWRDTERLVPALYDLDGKPFVSTTGEVLEDVLLEEPSEIVTLVKNMPGMPPWYGTCRNSVNSSPVWIDGIQFDTGWCRIKSRQLSGWKRENDVDFRTLQLEIHIQPEPWQFRDLLNRGFYELAVTEETRPPEEEGEEPQTVTKVIRKRIMIDGKPCVEPQLLGPDSKVIKFRDDEGNPIPGAGQIVKDAVQKFRVRKWFDFSLLPLR